MEEFRVKLVSYRNSGSNLVFVVTALQAFFQFDLRAPAGPGPGSGGAVPANFCNHFNSSHVIFHVLHCSA